MQPADSTPANGSPEDAERTRRVHDFARHLCRGAGPAGETGLDWDPVAREALLRLSALPPGGDEKRRIHAAVQQAMIVTSRARQRRPRAAGAAGPGPAFLGILSLLSEENRRIVERAFLQGQTYEAIARELRLDEAKVRERLAQGVRRARLIASGRGAE